MSRTRVLDLPAELRRRPGRVEHQVAVGARAWPASGSPALTRSWNSVGLGLQPVGGPRPAASPASAAGRAGWSGRARRPPVAQLVQPGDRRSTGRCRPAALVGEGRVDVPVGDHDRRRAPARARSRRPRARPGRPRTSASRPAATARCARCRAAAPAAACRPWWPRARAWRPRRSPARAARSRAAWPGWTCPRPRRPRRPAAAPRRTGSAACASAGLGWPGHRRGTSLAAHATERPGRRSSGTPRRSSICR